MARACRWVVSDVRVSQVQRDDLFALHSTVKDGEGSEAEVINRFSQSPHWGWSAVAPESKVFWVVDMGERILAIAQSVVHQLVDV
jgi:hypothetical protein